MKTVKYYILLMLLLAGSNFIFSQERQESEPGIEMEEIIQCQEIAPINLQNRKCFHIYTPTKTYILRSLSLSQKSEHDRWQRKLYIKSNAAAWGLLIGNIAAEIDLAPNWSITLPIYYSALNYFTSTIKFRTLAISLWKKD